RLFMCANQVGKTTGAGCELVYHLTGDYPKWWKGKRLKSANHWWVCGETTKAIIKVLQEPLLGRVGEWGTGLIPKDKLDFSYMTQTKKGDTFISNFRVKHTDGNWSSV